MNRPRHFFCTLLHGAVAFAVLATGWASAETTTPTYTLDSREGGWTAVVRADGSLETVVMTFGEQRVAVPWRSDDGRGPSWAGVAMSKRGVEGLVFEGRLAEQVYSLAYSDEGGWLCVTASLRNESKEPFAAAPRVRLTLGINNELKDPKVYYGIFFPTLLRCEQTHFWGYFQNPNGQVLAVASPDPVASWALGYIGQGHRIATSHLDPLHAPPLPKRHPQNLIEVAPGETRRWRLLFQGVPALSDVLPAVAAMSRAPMFELDRTTVAPGETVELVVHSEDAAAVEVAGVDSEGNAMELGSPRIEAAGRRYSLSAPRCEGLATITATCGGKRSEAMVYVRRPWGWYLCQARTEALRMQQKPSQHREAWLGLFSAYWAQLYFPDDKLLTETERAYKTCFDAMIDPDTFDYRIGKEVAPPRNGWWIWMANRPQNTSWRLGLLVARYAATRDVKHLEEASACGDLFIQRFQNPSGAFRGYTALTLGAKFLQELAWFERPLAANNAVWRERFERHMESVSRAAESLATTKDLGRTEGEATYEDNQAGSAWSLLALHAATAADDAKAERYLQESLQIQKRHECLTQALIPDARMRGGTLRWWESQYDVLTTPNMMNSPHGWTMRSQFGALYLYLLTGEERFLNIAFNAMGACAQAIDTDTGRLRWAFVPDPYVEAQQFVPDPAQPGKGKRAPVIIGEQWLPMISDWWLLPEGKVGFGGQQGWSCDNDVHEHFRFLANLFVPNAFVLERADGSLRAWNCRVDRDQDKLTITPAEPVVSRIHLNLRNDYRVTVPFTGEPFEGNVVAGRRWIGPGLRNPIGPDNYLWKETAP